MLNHIHKHQVLTSLNHGFRSGYSCETQLVVTAHDLLNFYDQNRQVDVVILDISKAFDTVSHGKILHKLDAYVIIGPLHIWIGNLLTQRKMNEVVEGEKSHSVHVGSGREVIKLEFILRLKIKRNDWLLADTCPQAANHCALFLL